MCDFNPGDEVVCIVAGNWKQRTPNWMFWQRMWRARDGGPRKNETGVVTAVGKTDHPVSGRELVMIKLTGWRDWYNAECFRKVQRRDLSAWLQTSVPHTDHLDKPLPAKKRERVE